VPSRLFQRSLARVTWGRAAGHLVVIGLVLACSLAACAEDDERIGVAAPPGADAESDANAGGGAAGSVDAARNDAARECGLSAPEQELRAAVFALSTVITQTRVELACACSMIAADLGEMPAGICGNPPPDDAEVAAICQLASQALRAEAARFAGTRVTVGDFSCSTDAGATSRCNAACGTAPQCGPYCALDAAAHALCSKPSFSVDSSSTRLRVTLTTNGPMVARIEALLSGAGGFSGLIAAALDAAAQMPANATQCAGEFTALVKASASLSAALQSSTQVIGSASANAD
jgi:hypothetical protein